MDNLVRPLYLLTLDGSKSKYLTAAKAIKTLIEGLNEIGRPKKWSEEYLASTCFRKPKVFGSNVEFNNYCKVNIRIAELQLNKLGEAFLSKALKNKTISNLHKHILQDYIFDLKHFIEFIKQKKDGSYVLFNGGKNYKIESFQFLHVTTMLLRGDNPAAELKACNALTIFSLRQALESRFERAVGIHLRDRQGKGPKLKHGFHLNYMMSRPHYFLLPANIKSISLVYDWCNEIVHGGYQPLAWQAAYAHEVCCTLFDLGPYRDGSGSSIYGAIQINEVEAMRQDFMAQFLSSYDHGIWCARFGNPEAGLNNV